jgi:hypothetical protein
MLPMTFLKTGVVDDIRRIPMGINERKISKDKSVYLGLGVMSNIYIGYSLYDLIYWDAIINCNKPDDIYSGMIHLEHF